MLFRRTVIASLACELPPEVVTSAELERRLAPVYDRLRLPEGRLELMTGIRERRFWPVDFRPSEASALAGRRALARSGLRPDQIDLFIHAAVCRDMLEPATAAFAHHRLGLSRRCQVFDLSNACLGFLNALTLAAAAIEAGQIRAALIASGENGKPLVEQTLATLLAGRHTRNEIKPFFANFTIGAGAVAAVLCHESLLPPGARPRRLIGGVVRAATHHSALCQGDTTGGHGLQMQTDSEALLLAGVATAKETWEAFQLETEWTVDDVDRFCCHQVGSVHRRKLFELLELDVARDYMTFDRLGNVGSVSCPLTLALAAEEGFVRDGHRVGLLGIGSGINCLMLGVEW